MDSAFPSGASPVITSFSARSSAFNPVLKSGSSMESHRRSST